ncbi:MAG: hypothetical protein ACKV2O_23240 [Acidimicrobiales bacterium]
MAPGASNGAIGEALFISARTRQAASKLSSCSWLRGWPFRSSVGPRWSIGSSGPGRGGPNAARWIGLRRILVAMAVMALIGTALTAPSQTRRRRPFAHSLQPSRTGPGWSTALSSPGATVGSVPDEGLAGR